VGLQKIMEKFLAEQIEPVAAFAAQHRVHYSGGKHAIGGVQQRPRNSHHAHQPAPRPPLSERLCVPSEEGYRPDGR